MKKTCWTTILMILGFAITVQAAPINLHPGPTFIQFNNLEQLDTNFEIVDGTPVFANSIDVPGPYGTAGNWGVLNVSSIQEGAVATPHQDINGGSVYFLDDGVSDPFGQGQVTGIFYDIQLQTATTATGGTIDLYWHDAADDFVTADHMSGVLAPPNLATVNAFTGGTFLVRLNLAPGILVGDGATTLTSDIDVTAITGTGRAELFADVDTFAGGAWATFLDTNWFYVDTDGNGVFGELNNSDGVSERRDVRLATFFNLLSAWDGPEGSGIVGLRSNDPARAYVIPEPSTFILLGVGLLGVAGMMRRRHSRKS